MKNKLFPLLLSALIFITTALPGNSFAQNDTDDGLYLETVGVLTAQSMYMTYAAIGMLADANENGVYEKDKALNYVGEYITLTKIAGDQIKKLKESDNSLTTNDQNYLEESIQTYTFLKEEAEALKNYIETQDRSYVDEFHRKRKAAWANIQNLLGLN